MELRNELPSKLYRVRVPEIATYSEAELEILGVPISIYDGYNRKHHYTETVVVMLPISRLVDIYSSGYSIEIMSRDDVTEVYNTLERYVNNSLEILNFSPNRAAVIEDRHEEIEKMLEEMFGYNKRTIVKETLKDQTSFGGLNINLFHDNYRPPVRNNQPVNAMAGYGYDEPINNQQPTTFIDPYKNLPALDIDKVQRVSRRRGITIHEINKL
jgi:hypothetical protein